jgi:hypothetical protein
LNRGARFKLIALNKPDDGTFKIQIKQLLIKITKKYLFLVEYNYMTFLIYNAKISDNNAESGKVPRILAAYGKGNPLKKEFL